MNRINIGLGLTLTLGLLNIANSPVQAQRCTTLPLVGGVGTKVEKTITTPSIPGPFGIKIASDNWNTDWSVPNSRTYNNYKATIVSETTGSYSIKLYLKYADETADLFYEQNDITLQAGKPLEISATSRRRDQPYQVNVFVGGISSVGNNYTASVVGCR